ncbi:MAG: CBS domain-containing protein [Actinomycetota bacterium]|jgi:CBS domain-containing protein|nr:CBS domain-containing protein [Actinomycetota bacterium]
MSQLSEFVRKPVFACSPGATLAMAAQEMDTHNVGSLVVTDRDDRILGMITDRDIALAIGRGSTPDTPVDRVSTHGVVTIRADSDVHDAAALMGAKGVWRLPVTDDGGRPVGMLSLNDVFGYLVHETESLSLAAHAHRAPRL